MRNIVKPVLTLFLVCVFVTFVVSFTYNLTKDAILLRDIEENLRAMEEVMPDSQPFTEITQDVISKVDTGDMGIRINNVYRSDNGYVFNVTVKGYAEGIVMTVGIGSNEKVTGVAIGRNSETPSIGKKVEESWFKSGFTGLSIYQGISDNVDTIGGATISSQAVIKGVSDICEIYRMYMEHGGTN